VLSGDAKFGGALVTGEATPDTITGTLRELAGKVKPGDQFVLALFGHSSAAGGEGRYVFRGPDLPLSALGEGAPSAGRKDGTVSLLEAYNWATHQTSLWIRRLRKGAGDDWIVTGRESVEVFKHLHDAPDGTPGGRRLSPRSNANVDDPVVPFVTTGAEAKAATGRRVLSEHATLEDTGEGLGKAAVRGNAYKPLAGQGPGEVGARARKVVLGRAALLSLSERSDRADGADRPAAGGQGA